MAAVNRLAAAVLALGILLAGCQSLEPDRQWYKPSGDYTAAELERDTKACTKGRVLSEECLQQHGWASLSGDRVPKKKEIPPPGSGVTPGRY
jgi:pectin methylesterase-like acyl-CoA thioesterase